MSHVCKLKWTSFVSLLLCLVSGPRHFSKYTFSFLCFKTEPCMVSDLQETKDLHSKWHDHLLGSDTRTYSMHTLKTFPFGNLSLANLMHKVLT